MVRIQSHKLFGPLANSICTSEVDCISTHDSGASVAMNNYLDLALSLIP